MRALERYLLLQIIDQRWREHLYDMDYLREGIHLRGFAQIDPLVAYKNEALHALPGPDELDLDGLRADDLPRRGRDRGRRTARARVPPSRPRGGSSTGGGRVSYSGGGPVGSAEALAMATAGADQGAEAYADGEVDEQELALAPEVEQRVVDEHDADRAQRPVLVRLGQEVQEVPRRVTAPPAAGTAGASNVRRMATAPRPTSPPSASRRSATS